MKKIFSILLLACSFTTTQAQIVDRERPAEWASLVRGGAYIDRFGTMPGNDLRSDVWGCKDVLPRLVDNGIEVEGFSVWGGNILQLEDGQYHLFACGWPEDSPKGHMFWGNSTVFHATAPNKWGPFKIQQTIGKGHNPEAYRLEDGRIVIYTIDGYYINHVGRLDFWTFGKYNFDNRDRRVIEGLSNLTFCRRQDGSRLMVCRGGGIWVSRDGLTDPWHQLTYQRVYPDVDGRFEDPIVWRDSIQYHLIVNDWLGRLAWYERSLDGVHWVVEPGEAYVPGIARHADGTKEEWFKYERAKVFQDRYGRVEQMNFAVIDTLKDEDKPRDRHSSKNICISMNTGLLLSVLNTERVTTKTKKIRLLVKAEEGFDPATDLDIKSLRFGSYKEVNFGRGAQVEKVEQQGSDIILTFNGKMTGIDEEEFAPKLIGSRKDGSMVYGYTRLPGIKYTPAILSALRPVLTDNGTKARIVVENYGLTASEPTIIQLRKGDTILGKADLPVLQPYGKTEVIISLSATLSGTDRLEVVAGDNTPYLIYK